MNKALSFLLGLLVLSGCSDSNSQAEKIDLPNHNWRIQLPEGFEKVSSTEGAELQAKGIEAIEETHEQEFTNIASTLFMYRKDESNYMDANTQPFDPAIDGDYISSCKAINEIVYETFEQQMHGLPMDSSATTLTVDGVEFQQFTISIDLPGNNKMTTHIYSHLFDTTELSLNILYVDPEMGTAMIDAFKNSKFQ